MLTKFRVFSGAIILIACVLSGCSHIPPNPDYAGPKILPDKIKKEFASEKFRGDYLESVLEKKEAYTIRRIEFSPAQDVSGISHNLVLDYYDVGYNKPGPVVLCLPILGGSNLETEFFARYYASRGLAAIVVHRQKGYKNEKNLDKLDGILRQMVFDHKQAIDWVEMRPELDGRRIGVFGISMGSIKASLLQALDPRVSAGVYCLVGGDLPYILAHSNEPGIIKRRKQIMADKGLSETEFYDTLQKKIQCDPINYAEYIDAKRVLMVLALFDKTVPYEKGIELWEKIGRPELYKLPASHYTSLVFIFYIRSRAFDFFDKHL
ncbi:MAG: alpha/beta hydrolase [Candidatus Falkowbacteria bacterium]